MKLKINFVFMLIIIAVPVFFCREVIASAPSRTVIIAQNGDVVSLNPLLIADSASSAVCGQIFNRLLRYDENMQVVCDLAEKYDVFLNQYVYFDTVEISDPDIEKFKKSIAGLMAANPVKGLISDLDFRKIVVGVERNDSNSVRITIKNSFNTALCKLIEKNLGVAVKKTEYKPVFLIKVRKGVVWHDGKPFSVDDVVFTLDTIIKNTAIPAFKRYDVGAIEKISAVGEDAVEITFAYPSPRVYDTLQVPILPRHRLAGQDIVNARFNMSPVGTGPFKFKDRAIEDYITLEKNSDYFAGAPEIDVLTFRIIPSESIMFLELLAGNIDIMQLKPDQFVKFTQTPEFEKRFIKLRYPEPEYTYIGWNLKNRLFLDPRVRAAMGMAIDKNALIEKVLYNLGQISNGPFYPKSWAANPSVRNLPYDPKKASAMLAEAGWRDSDGDGVLEKDFGGGTAESSLTKFEFRLLINAGKKDRELCAEFIASELKKIGIRVIVDTLEWKDMIKLIDDTRFDAFIMTWGLPNDPDISYIWHSSQIPDPAKQKFGLNSVSYSNPEVDSLFDEAKQTFDRAERTEKYRRIHEIIMNEQPYTFLYIADTLYAVSKKIGNVKPSQIGIYYNVEKWRLQNQEEF